jgi:hypothetical protein
VEKRVNEVENREQEVSERETSLRERVRWRSGSARYLNVRREKRRERLRIYYYCPRYTVGVSEVMILLTLLS